MNFDRFRAPTAADDLQTCGGCYVKLPPELLDRNGDCYESCSPYSDEYEERRAELESESKNK